MAKIVVETSVVTSVPITDSPDNTFIFDLNFEATPSNLEEYSKFIKDSIGIHFVLLKQFLEFRAKTLEFTVDWKTAKTKIEEIHG